MLHACYLIQTHLYRHCVERQQACNATWFSGPDLDPSRPALGENCGSVEESWTWDQEDASSNLIGCFCVLWQGTIQENAYTDHIRLACTVGPQNAPLHNMLLLVAYCVPCIHNMLRWSILCTLHTQYATSGAYCVGSIHMLFQWSSEGTQYALLENMSRGICLSF